MGGHVTIIHHSSGHVSISIKGLCRIHLCRIYPLDSHLLNYVGLLLTTSDLYFVIVPLQRTALHPRGPFHEFYQDISCSSGGFEHQNLADLPKFAARVKVPQ